ncbi:hypothetical protein GMORB2_1686 [Geosmithia morbida]|uniref:TeaA receptor TeaR n=1 Tax=Geosmithia morbida TaxID=1094350 RepID=A0A9P5D2U6_9HYPO|nr:uncharacterized protein GMORB2_1686 [Geosmithia morbida]KAF4121846.1 hypothetical protein GMORB2_1686 [Geosmithia morbida]
MAAVSSAHATATSSSTLTPPSSSLAHDTLWDDANQLDDDSHAEDDGQDSIRSPAGAGPSTGGAQVATRRMRSADNLAQESWDDSGAVEAEDGTLIPAYAPDSRSNDSWRSQSPSKSRDRHDSNYVLREPSGEDGNDSNDSKWIHRDKLAKIESQELQAAGIYIPRSRAPSKQRSRSSARRGTNGTDASEQPRRSRSRKSSSAVEQRHVPPDIAIPSWDLRTPEEIAEEEASAYFTTNGLRGGSRIPVAKTSPAPIPVDYLERGSPSTRKYSESPESDSMMHGPSRSGSTSGSLYEKPPPGMAKRSQDASPRKPTSRKTSTATKNSSSQARPKTRSSSGTGTRPSTRSGEPANMKPPEGDPPWLVNAYKPDPRLPPDQQLLPTVARRLQQEQWEKNGTHGDTYDKEFRPLNDRDLARPAGADKTADKEDREDKEDKEKQDDTLSPPGQEWPLRPDGAAKSQVPRPGSYSTMPKISDKPAAASSPLVTSPNPMQSSGGMFQASIEPQSPAAQRVPDEKEDDAKGGCGCCVVM